ncbi:hypothetical protein HYW76_02880 [Candidatus Pacearchaeota archaeon]|nr:hypothetical protein [Candidatus Pacearchaeota archaeon]
MKQESALWGKVAGKEREEIEKQAKEIMNSFAEVLENISVKDARIEREEDRREEKGGGDEDKDFRKIMFENAPKTEENCIVAEKGEWVK